VAQTGLIGDWVWVRTILPNDEVMEAPVGGKFVLTFDEDGQLSSSTDCNYLSSGYVKDEEVLSIGPVGMTKMYCEGSKDSAYAEQLGRAASHVIDGDELRIILVRDAGTMVFSRKAAAAPVTVSPISHASMVLHWGDVTLMNDPTGDAAAYDGKGDADIILVSDVHGDHLSASTLQALLRPETALMAPQAVIDQLPEALKVRATKLANGETRDVIGISITAIPMYNLPESADSRHVKGRGNGYVLEKDGFRVYIAGDTAGIPEMRALRDIDMAFVPMNGPTMPVEEAADAVLAFAPRQVYPYHYRSQGGLSDVARFKELVDAGGKDVEVVQLDWYPAQ
jgi:L-ascorbate metabolism protein UlaG (beta-lactamase superfamily)/heat shock protein HslJ